MDKAESDWISSNHHHNRDRLVGPPLRISVLDGDVLPLNIAEIVLHGTSQRKENWPINSPLVELFPAAAPRPESKPQTRSAQRGIEVALVPPIGRSGDLNTATPKQLPLSLAPKSYCGEAPVCLVSALASSHSEQRCDCQPREHVGRLAANSAAA